MHLEFRVPSQRQPQLPYNFFICDLSSLLATMPAFTTAALPDELFASLKKARDLGCKPADEHQPYSNRYAAAEQLQELLQQACNADAACSTPEAAEFASWCKVERGLQLLETDLLAEGQKALEEGLSHAWPSTVECLAIQLQAHNALAQLWCERSENETALEHLQSAADLYSAIKQQQQQQKGASPSSTSNPPQEALVEQQGAPEPSSPCTAAAAATAAADADAVAGACSSDDLPRTSSSSSWHAALVDAEQIERDYTTTLFFKAQVHGLMGQKVQSASYCAATLNRQLKQGDLDINEWVQNCLQMSGFFLDCNAFGLSRHCCAAAEAVLLQRYQQTQQQQEASENDTTDSTTQDKDTAGDQAQQQGQDQQGPSSNSKDQTDSKDQAGKQEQQQQQKDPVSKQQQQRGEAVPGGPSAQLLAALSLLEEDVAANVCLAFAKLHLYTLVASHEAFLEGKQVAFAFNSAAEVPAVLSFDAVQGLPALSSLAWGHDALVGGYEGALQHYKAALPWFKRALEHYQLDGWVTEHCNILFEMSNLYRCLAGFESDPHKRCVMHRSRTKLLQPLEGQLSTTHYPGLSRSISLELGNIFREIADIKGAAGREGDKVASAMQSAAQHYKLFLDSFRGADGQLPASVEPEMEQHYLSCLFSMARMLQGLPHTGTLGSKASPDNKPEGARQEVATMEEAVSLLNALVKYVHENNVADWQEQADMAKELGSLLKEKLDLVHRFSEL